MGCGGRLNTSNAERSVYRTDVATFEPIESFRYGAGRSDIGSAWNFERNGILTSLNDFDFEW